MWENLEMWLVKLQGPIKACGENNGFACQIPLLLYIVAGHDGAYIRIGGKFPWSGHYFM